MTHSDYQYNALRPKLTIAVQDLGCQFNLRGIHTLARAKEWSTQLGPLEVCSLTGASVLVPQSSTGVCSILE
jgi:hypothetical protein